MDNKALHDNFRRQLTNVHGLTVLTVSLAEIVAYIVLVRSGVQQWAWDNRYLQFRVILPIVVNVLTHVVARIVVFRTAIRRKQKNAAIITATMITTFMVAIPHKEYPVTGCAFVFPIILSAMFNDRKLLNTGFVVSLCILGCVGAAFGLDPTVAMDVDTVLNLMVLFGFALIAYLCGVISINFSRQTYTTIQSQAEDNDKLRDDVLRDHMTGLYNHQAFLADLESAVAQAETAAPFCLAILDIDNFKHVNDTYGHHRGDEVLVYMAQAIRRHCDDDDRAYRYGGEEFAILFGDKSADEACAVLNRVLEAVRTHRFSFTEEAITFSAGVVAHREGITRDVLFDAADLTMYGAKQAGKNRVLMSN